MTNIRVMPILLTVLVSGTVLFGGWFGYRHYMVEQPLTASIAAVPGLEASKPVVTKDRVTVEVAIGPDTELSDVYQQIRQETSGTIGSRTLELLIEQQPDETLERIWSSALFDVAQAMENRQYADLPAMADKLMQAHDGLEVQTAIDDMNVYITLKREGAAKYVILPREPATMGVWPNA